ncbi:hypothetical protein GXW83_00350 [Streptacidiphilus sp. PB12-B1b]|uniref:hypothetical protein n=1 Tax=Streptacidiphilus sp. PB12-B1b TaxID=2705012 RepID=UPI0015FB9812|nr:hypothetical protein [Streptacidiphilus sp. PB12-B1b]QMU74468.1 hypothetical protein GXW83_00350 [Streptacidiphilus sp. PB12-B1b]
MPPEVALLESRALRDSVHHRTDALDRVKALVLLPDGVHVTTRMVADYYEVGIEAVQSLVKDHREELLGTGYRILAGQELMLLKNMGGVHPRTPSLAVFPRRAVLNIAMLLRDSAVARQVRVYLLDTEADRHGPAAPPRHGMPPGRRLGPGPHWDEYEYLQAHPDAPTPEQYTHADQGRWADLAESVDRRLDAHGRVVGAMSEQLCALGDDVRELREDVSGMRKDVSELRQGRAADRRRRQR